MSKSHQCPANYSFVPSRISGHISFHEMSSWMESKMTNIDLATANQTSIANLPWKWLRRLRERRELMALLDQPDYILKDIGLQRDEISREGLKRFWSD